MSKMPKAKVAGLSPPMKKAILLLKDGNVIIQREKYLTTGPTYRTLRKYYRILTEDNKTHMISPSTINTLLNKKMIKETNIHQKCSVLVLTKKGWET